MLIAALTGFVTGFSLILAIGAQNAFILRQGLIRQHIFWLCLFFALSDAALIVTGVLGFGVIVEAYPALPQIMAWGGAAFLTFYALSRLYAAWWGDYDMALDGKSAGLGKTMAMAAAFTWLNPHVYLDTLGLIGAISTQFPPPGPRTAYAIGAVTASFVFFFGLGYGSRLLAPVMQTVRAWRVLDTVIALTMLLLAAKLVS